MLLVVLVVILMLLPFLLLQLLLLLLVAMLPTACTCHVPIAAVARNTRQKQGLKWLMSMKGRV
jgi:hypothetical protein